MSILDDDQNLTKSRVVSEPRMQGPQTIPEVELRAIQRVVEGAICMLTGKRSAILTIDSYTAHARLVGTQWKGEIMISVTRGQGQ